MPAPRAPFDQGLFLTHFNKGKQLYDQRQFAEAEQQLEEAYLLRPCLLYTSPSPRDGLLSRMPSSA